MQSSPIVAFSKEEEECFLNDWNNDGKRKICDKILVRAVWTGLMGKQSKIGS